MLATLVLYVDHLSNTLQKKRTVPRAVMQHIGWVDAFLGEVPPWPVKHGQIQRRVSSHHKRKSQGKPATGFLYTPKETCRLPPVSADPLWGVCWRAFSPATCSSGPANLWSPEAENTKTCFCLHFVGKSHRISP